jgi:hypothetical protein
MHRLHWNLVVVCLLLAVHVTLHVQSCNWPVLSVLGFRAGHLTGLL